MKAPWLVSDSVDVSDVEVAEVLARHGVVVLVPVIAPYARARDLVREHHQERGTSLLQVHVSTPIETTVTIPGVRWELKDE